MRRAALFVGLLTVALIGLASARASRQLAAAADRALALPGEVGDHVGVWRATDPGRPLHEEIGQHGREIGVISLAAGVAALMLAGLGVWLERENTARERVLTRLRAELEARESTVDELRAANLSLERRVEELGKANALSAASNAEFEAFSYAVSHDLRTPLRAIDGFALALAQDFSPVLGNAGQDFLRRIRRGTARMSQIIEDMLALSRLTRSSLVCADVDVTEIADEVARDLRARDVTRDVEFEIERGLTVFGDAGLIRIVFENLLENAWKFTSRVARAHIAVGTEAAIDGRLVYVRDDGAGFDPAIAARLFGAFQRLHRDDEFSGIGIGLATVKRVMMLHGGHVRAEGATDRGATFYLRFAEPEGSETGSSSEATR